MGCRCQQEVCILIIPFILPCLRVICYSDLTILFCKVQSDMFMFSVWRSISVSVVFSVSLTWKNFRLDLSLILGCRWFLHKDPLCITHCSKREKTSSRKKIYARLKKYCSSRAISRFQKLNDNAVCYQTGNDKNIS